MPDYSKDIGECDFCGEFFCQRCSFMDNFCSERCIDAWDKRDAIQKSKTEVSNQE